MSDVFLCKTWMSIFCMSNILFVFVFFVSSLVFICVDFESGFDVFFCVIPSFFRYVWPRLLTFCLFAARWLHYLFSTAITLVTVLMNWPPVFHLQWLGHVPHVRQHLPTTIVWNSPMRELIGSVMVSSLLLPTFGTLSLPLYFRLPSTFLPSKGRSITTLGARWHDFFFFFITLFRCFFINSF